MWLLNKLTGYDEENAKRAAATDNGTYTSADGRTALATSAWQQNQRDRGLWTEWEYQQAQANLNSANASSTDAAIETTFVDSVKENADAMAGGVKGALNGVAGTLWKAFPWWLWLVAAAALFIYLGGGVVIRSRIQKLA